MGGSHSARKIQNSYPCPITGGRDYVSKWGLCGLYQHARGHDPYLYFEPDAPMEYYKLKTNHSGTINNYPKNWIGTGNRIHTISSTLTIPPSAILQVGPGATVQMATGQKIYVSGVFNALGVTFTGSNWGGIVFQSGSSGTISSCNINNVLANSGAAITLFNSVPLIEYSSICNLQGTTSGIALWDVQNGYPYLNDNYVVGAAHGIFMYNSQANITNNYLQATQSALYLNRSTAFFHPTNNPAGYGYNDIMSSDIGIAAYNYSNVYAGGNNLNGYYNSFLFNNTYNATAGICSQIYAENNTWYPQPPQKIYYSSDSYIDWEPLENSSLKVSSNDSFKSNEETFFWNDLKKGLDLVNSIEESDAISHYKSLLKKYSSHSQLANIISDLGNFYKLTKSPTIKSALKVILVEQETSTLIRSVVLTTLADISLFDKDFIESLRLNYALVNEYPGGEHEKNARLNLFTIYYLLNNTELAQQELSLIPKVFTKDDEVSFAHWLLNSSPIIKKNQLEDISSTKGTILKDYKILGNYPNPFNSSTVIRYYLPHLSSVELIIFDIMGRQIKSFIIPSQLAGVQEIFWDGKNNNGENVASGVYIYKIRLSSLENTKVFEKASKLMMLK